MTATAEPPDTQGATIAIPPEAEQVARELAATVHAVAQDLPFGADPAGFLAALERLAEGQEPVEPGGP